MSMVSYSIGKCHACQWCHSIFNVYNVIEYCHLVSVIHLNDDIEFGIKVSYMSMIS